MLVFLFNATPKAAVLYTITSYTEVYLRFYQQSNALYPKALSIHKFSSGVAIIYLFSLNPSGGNICPFQGSTASLSSPSSACAS